MRKNSQNDLCDDLSGRKTINKRYHYGETTGNGAIATLLEGYDDSSYMTMILLTFPSSRTDVIS